MRVSVDTNVLVRLFVRDDDPQASAAMRLLQNAERIAITLPCLCELAWVLNRVYKLRANRIAEAIRTLSEIATVQMNRPAVEAGLAMLDAGGDFADGVIAHEGAWLGGETFVSFDKKAVKLLHGRGVSARHLI